MRFSVLKLKVGSTRFSGSPPTFSLEPKSTGAIRLRCFGSETNWDQRLEFLHWCFMVFYIVNNAHIVGYCEGVIAYRLIFFTVSHKMLHQICTKLTPSLEYDFEDSPLLQQVAFSGYLLLPNYPLQKPVAYHMVYNQYNTPSSRYRL